MTLSVDSNPGGFGTSPNAMLVMRSTDGGATWSDPITLKRDENPNVLNDKNTLTADPNDSDFVYAVWDRLVSPPGETPNPEAFENALAFRGPVWFSRTTNGGASWETARLIYQPGTLNQTIGNQIVVLPDNAQFDGELVDVFDLIQNRANRPPGRGFSIAVIRSTDNGATWSKNAITVDRHNTFQGLVVDPDDPNPATNPVRTGDIIPQVTVDPNSGAIYVVFQDSRFGPRSSIAFTQSLDGGLTWSPTIKINQTPTDISLGNQQAFNPVASVLDDGTIGVRYSDFRANQAFPAIEPLATDEFLTHCHPDHAERLRERGELGRGGADSPTPRTTCARRPSHAAGSSGTTSAWTPTARTGCRSGRSRSERIPETPSSAASASCPSRTIPQPTNSSVPGNRPGRSPKPESSRVAVTRLDCESLPRGSPSIQHLARPLEPAPTNALCQRVVAVSAI